MKTSDISDEAFLSIVREFNKGTAPDEVFPERWSGGPKPFLIREYVVTGPRWAFVWNIAERLDVPEKLVRSKARSLIRRGLMRGCPCGCRGDFVVVLPRG